MNKKTYSRTRVLLPCAAALLLCVSVCASDVSPAARTYPARSAASAASAAAAAEVSPPMILTPVAALASVNTYAAAKTAKDELVSRGARAIPGQDAELWILERQYTGAVRVRDGVTFVGLGEFSRFTEAGKYVCTAGVIAPPDGVGENAAESDPSEDSDEAPAEASAPECTPEAPSGSAVPDDAPEDPTTPADDASVPRDPALPVCARLTVPVLAPSLPDGVIAASRPGTVMLSDLLAPDDEADDALPDGFTVIEAEVSGGRYNVRACAGDEYVVSNGRYFWGRAESFAEGTELFVPVCAAARAFGLGTDENGRVTGGGDVTDGEEFYREDEVYWLSHIIEAESGCEPLRGKIAVGTVVLNRVADPQFPDTIWAVIWDDRFGVQFSPTESGTIWNDPSEDSVIAAKICLEGERVSDTVMYFVNPVIAESTWVQDNRPFEMMIGRHAFFG